MTTFDYGVENDLLGFLRIPLLGSKKYLLDHPNILSKGVQDILQDWEEKATQKEESNFRNAVIASKIQLRFMWLFFVEAYLSFPATYRRKHIFADILERLNISTSESLNERINIQPGLYQEILLESLKSFDDSDWAIILLLTNSISEEEDELDLVSKIPSLLDNQVIYKLELFLDWATKQNLETEKSIISQGLEFLRRLGREVAEGSIVLGNALVREKILRLLSSESWAEAKRIAMKFEKEVLSDDGLIEAESIIESLFLTSFIENKLDLSLISAMQLLEVLNKSRVLGIENSFASKRLPLMPAELWIVAGLICISSKPRITSWNLFKNFLETDPEFLETRAKYLAQFLRSYYEQEDGHVQSDVSNTIDLIGNDCVHLTLLQFAFRESSTKFIWYLNNEPRLIDGQMNRTVTYLFDLYEKADRNSDQFLSAAPLIGFLQIMRNPESEILQAVQNLDIQALEDLIPTGAYFATLIGGILALMNCKKVEDQASWIKQFPMLSGEDAIELLRLVIMELQKNANEREDQDIQELLKLLIKANEVGINALSLAQSIPLENNDLVKAILVWNEVSDSEQMEKIIEDYPVLLSIQAIDFIAELLESSLSHDFSDNQEVNNYISSTLKEKFSSLLSIKREMREVNNEYYRIVPDLPGKERAASLIWSLEVSFPAKLWVPVSRVDLTDAFFGVLSSWGEQIEVKFGKDEARYLRNLSEQAPKWLAEFGPRTEAHTSELSEFLDKLFKLFVSMDHNGKFYERLADIADKHPEIISNASLDILSDWEIMLKKLQNQELIDTLQEIKEWIEKCLETDPQLVAVDLRIGKIPVEVAKLAEKYLGRDNIESYTEFFMACLKLPKEQIPEIFTELMEALHRTDIPLPVQEVIIKVFQEGIILTEFMDACTLGDTEKVKNLLFNEPFLSTDNFLKMQRSYVGDKEIPEIVQRITPVMSIPMIRKLIANQVTEAERATLNDTLKKITGIFLLDNWYMRFVVLQIAPEILSDTTWALLTLFRDQVIDELTEKLGDRNQANERFTEIEEVLINCRKFSIEEELYKFFLSSSGKEVGTRGNLESGGLSSFFVMLLRLPEKWRNSIAGASTAKDTILIVCEMMKEVELPDDMKASSYAFLGLMEKTVYEQTDDIEMLENSIRDYGFSLELTPKRLPNLWASRNVSLGASLREYFDLGGGDKDTLEKSINILSDVIITPGISSVVLAKGLGYLGAALTCRYESFGIIQDAEEAIRIIREAITLTPEEDRDWFGWHINLGVVYARIGDDTDDQDANNESMHIYSYALSKLQEGQYPELRTILMHNLSNLELDNYPSLQKINGLIRQSLDDLDRNLSQNQRAGVYNHLGSAYSKKFFITRNKVDIDFSVENFRASISLLQKDSPDWIKYNLNLADKLRQRGELFGVYRDVVEAFKIYDAILNSPLISYWPQLILDCAEKLGNTFGERGLSDQSIVCFSTAVDALNIMRNSTPNLDERLRMSLKSAGFIKKLISLHLWTNNINRALEYTESLKAQVFSDQLLSGHIDVEPIDPKLKAMIEERERLEKRIVGLRRKLAEEFSVDGSSVVDTEGLRRKVEETFTEIKILDKRLLYEYPNYSDLRVASNMTFIEVCNLSKKLEATFIEYVYDFQGLGVFVVSNDSVNFVRIEAEPSWVDWIVSLAFGKNGTNDVNLEKTLGQLYNNFISPIKHLLPPRGSKVIICPTGPLSIMPLSSALDENGDPLFMSFCVGISPSIKALAVLNENRHPNQFGNILAIAYAGDERSKHYLPFAETEAYLVSSLFNNSTIISGKGTNAEQILSKMSEYDVVHFASHGHLSGDMPESSGLVLADGKWLTISDIVNRMAFKKSPIIVLNACNIGHEHLQENDEHLGIPRAFLFAGASSVVANMWPVDDFPSALFMKHFHEELHKIQRETGSVFPAEALRNSQNWIRSLSKDELLLFLEDLFGDLVGNNMLDGARVVRYQIAHLRPRSEYYPYSDPYYWAGYLVIGLMN